MGETKYTWTVSIIAQYDSAVKKEYLELEDSILTQIKNRNIRYAIFFYDQTEKTAKIKLLKYKRSKKPLFKEINLGKIDFYKKNNNPVTEFLEHYVYRKEENHRFLMITWGHGAGLGIFVRTEPEGNGSKVANGLAVDENIVEKLKRAKAQLSVDNKLIDFKKLYTDLITNNEFSDNVKMDFQSWQSNLVENIELITAEYFAQILQTGLKKEKIEILICMNCYMQTFETGFALRNCVNFLVAPQTTISFRGYNYKKLFVLLHQNPECNAQEISKNLVNNFERKYKKDVSIKSSEEPLPSLEPNLSEMSFSVNDLSKYCCIRDIINKIAKYLLDNYIERQMSDTISLMYKVDKARSHCLWLTWRLNMGIIDFKHFINELSKQLTPEDFRDILIKDYTNLESIQQKTVLAFHSPSRLFYNVKYRLKIVSSSPQFFSIFFPDGGGDDKYVCYFLKNFYSRNGTGQPELNENFIWGDFILLFCESKNICPQ